MPIDIQELNDLFTNEKGFEDIKIIIYDFLEFKKLVNLN